MPPQHNAVPMSSPQVGGKAGKCTSAGWATSIPAMQIRVMCMVPAPTAGPAGPTLSLLRKGRSKSQWSGTINTAPVATPHQLTDSSCRAIMVPELGYANHRPPTHTLNVHCYIGFEVQHLVRAASCAPRCLRVDLPSQDGSCN